MGTLSHSKEEHQYNAKCHISETLWNIQKEMQYLESEATLKRPYVKNVQEFS